MKSFSQHCISVLINILKLQSPTILNHLKFKKERGM